MTRRRLIVTDLDGSDDPSPEPLNLSDCMDPIEWAELARRTEEEASSPDHSVLDVAAGEAKGQPQEKRQLRPAGRGGLRQLMVLMERPFFALSKRRTSVAEYVSPSGDIRILVEPGAAGMATVYDADLVMFLLNQVANSAPGIGSTLLLEPSEYFAAVGSRRGGDQYRSLRDTIERLLTTRVTTNAGPDGKPGPTRTFSWLEQAVRERDGWHVRMADWIAEGATTRYMLLVSPEYFGLSGYERFLYLTARKHVGRDPVKRFPIGISTLWKKSGSAAPLARFRHEMKRLAEQNALPDYSIEWDERSVAKREAHVVFARKSGLV